MLLHDLEKLVDAEGFLYERFHAYRRLIDILERRDHDHRHLGNGLRQKAAGHEELATVHYGHHPVEQDQRGMRRFPEGIECQLSVGVGLHLVAFRFEDAAHGLPDIRVVFDGYDQRSIRFHTVDVAKDEPLKKSQI